MTTDSQSAKTDRQTPANLPSDGFRPLPALRGLARLADLRPVVVVDTREQQPLAFSRLESRRATLHTGDYSFAGAEDLFAVERKSIPDLVGCCIGNGRAHFFRELHRLRGFWFARLLIVGTPADIETARYRANVTPAAVLATIAAIEVRFVPVVFAPTPAAAAHQVERWAYWFARELCQTANSLLRGTEMANGAAPRSSPSPRFKTCQRATARPHGSIFQPHPSAAAAPSS